MATDPIVKLRAICLSFPEAHEKEAWGEPTFRIRDKMFATYAAANNHHGAGRPSMWVKSTHVTQDFLVHAKPDRYFVPPYVGKSGWIGVYLDKRPPWKELTELLHDGYRSIAPKRLLQS